MKKLITILIIISRHSIAYSEIPNVWSIIKNPINDIAQSIGSYSNGCQQGAISLPEHGNGYHDIRRSRYRYFTQPDTITLINTIGNAVSQYSEEILIGDLSQPIGGLMSYAHVSHQNGLDVDIYFKTIPRNAIPDTNEEIPVVVDKALGLMLIDRWKSSYRDALYAAATYPKTARIFVNPIIKQYLCQTESDTAWLQKIRPWNGHDEHFHIRLNCPSSSQFCINQDAIPPGDGCDANLDKWVFEQSDNILNPPPQKPAFIRPRPEPHQRCKILLIRAQMQLNKK